MTQRRVSVRSFDGFAYSMGSEYVTPSFLRRLFVVDSEEEAGPLALVDVHELDVFAEDEHGCFPVGELNPAAMYQLVPQAVIDVSEGDDDEDDDNKPQTPLQAKYLPREGARKRAIPQERAAAVKRAVLEIVGELYRPAHPRLFVFSEEYLEPAFAAAAKAGDAGYLQRATGTGLYAGKMFTDAFCAMFVEEIESFERSGMPLTRPNSMNNYGIILRDVGLADMVERVLADYLAPLSAKLYPDYEEAQSIDSMHAFIVQYRLSEDRSLDFHYDDAHVTMNVCLGKQFKGGDLYFKGLLNDPTTHNELFKLSHTPGYGCIHLGQHRHGAESITEGERYNLIVWGRSARHYAMFGKANPQRRHDEQHEHSHSHGHSHGDHGHCDHGHCDHDHDE